MPPTTFGRTNRVLPAVWLQLAQPDGAAPNAYEDLAASALASGAPIDLTTGPALWGGFMRGTDAFLTIAGNRDYERATDDRHSADLVSAHLLESLSAIGRESWDIYFLRVRQAVEEYQISGALEALEMAKQEGHVRYLGLLCDGPALATLGMWQFHDAFEALLVKDQDGFDTLSPMAKSRRVGVVRAEGVAGGDGPTLITVRSAEDVRRATRSHRDV
ncbi:MAG TPA: hypothetical protein VGE01_14525 [Fimbriimonas sp.]